MCFHAVALEPQLGINRRKAKLGLGVPRKEKEAKLGLGVPRKEKEAKLGLGVPRIGNPRDKQKRTNRK